MSRQKRQKTDTKMSPAVEVVQKPEITDTLLRDDRNGELMKLKLRNKGLPAQDRSWLWTTAETYSTDFEKLRIGTFWGCPADTRQVARYCFQLCDNPKTISQSVSRLRMMALRFASPEKIRRHVYAMQCTNACSVLELSCGRRLHNAQ